MYLIKKTKSFDKSFKKLKKSGIKPVVFENLKFIINSLAQGKNLPEIYKDHELNGEFLNYRECHIKSDLLLVYKLEKKDLILVGIGSHSYLFK